MGKTNEDEDIIIDEENTEEAPKKRGRGHPKAKINKDEFEKLCGLQCKRRNFAMVWMHREAAPQMV